MTHKRVLVLLPSQQDYEELHALEHHGYVFDFFDDNSWRNYEPSLKFNPLSYIRQCVERIRHNDLSAIFYTADLPNFIAAAVANEVGLPGPSVESMFLANHKLYSRMVENNPIWFKGFALDDDTWKMLLDFPVHIKPVSLCFSLLQCTARSERELEAAVEKLKINVPVWERPSCDLFRQYISKEQYPLSSQYCFLVEEFVENAISQHAVEGWTDTNGNQHIWAVSDNNYFTGASLSLDNNSIPTRLNSTMADAVCKVALDTVSKFGLKNGFWNVEIWIRSDGRIQVTEVNGRVCASMTPLYKNVLGKSQYLAALKVACGLPVDVKHDIPLQPVGVGAMFAISTSRQGCVRDLLRLDEFNEIKRINGVIKTKLMYDSDFKINWYQTGGKCCIARAWIVGNDYAEIAEKADFIRRRVLVETE